MIGRILVVVECGVWCKAGVDLSYDWKYEGKGKIQNEVELVKECPTFCGKTIRIYIMFDRTRIVLACSVWRWC